MAATVFLIAALFVCAAVYSIFREGSSGRGSNLASGYAEVANRVSFQLYQPSYLPPGAGEPLHRVPASSQDVQEVTARYPGGLILEQSSEQTVVGGATTQPVKVQGAEEAFFSDFAQRTLVFRKGNTWINLAGAEDEELIKVAESLRPVQR